MECGRHFIQAKDLKKHKWAGSIQERNHISAIIVERFSQGENLKRHTQKKTPHWKNFTFVAGAAIERIIVVGSHVYNIVSAKPTITKMSLKKQNNHVAYFIVILLAVTII